MFAVTRGRGDGGGFARRTDAGYTRFSPCRQLRPRSRWCMLGHPRTGDRRGRAGPTRRTNEATMDDLQTQLSRDILPIPDPKPVGPTTYNAKDPNTKYPPIVPLRPPAGAPNILIVLID